VKIIFEKRSFYEKKIKKFFLTEDFQAQVPQLIFRIQNTKEPN